MTANLFLPTSFVDLISLGIRIFPALSDSPVVDTRVIALEETLETSKERISALESQAASKDAESVTKVAQVASLEGHVRRGGRGVASVSDYP